MNTFKMLLFWLITGHNFSWQGLLLGKVQMVQVLWEWYVNIWAMSWQNLFMPYTNNKGTDQPVHLCSLNSTFVIHCLDSMINVVAISKIWRLFARFCSWADQFESYLTTKLQRQVLSWQWLLWFPSKVFHCCSTCSVALFQNVWNNLEGP